jgi:hypothetical protein
MIKIHDPDQVYIRNGMLILRFFVKIAPESLLHQARIQQFWKRGPRLLFEKSKIDKNHSYAIFPYKNNHIFYDYSEINQKGPPVRKTWLK